MKPKIFVVEQDLVKSRAWLTLGGIAPAIYLIFLTKRVIQTVGPSNAKRKVCVNCQEITFYYREAAKKYGITQSRFTRAIDQLIAHGFIDIVEPGNGTAKTPTKYGISERWRKYGTADFQVERRDPVKRGFCKSAVSSQNEHAKTHLV